MLKIFPEYSRSRQKADSRNRFASIASCAVPLHLTTAPDFHRNFFPSFLCTARSRNSKDTECNRSCPSFYQLLHSCHHSQKGVSTDETKLPRPVGPSGFIGPRIAPIFNTGGSHIEPHAIHPPLCMCFL